MNLEENKDSKGMYLHILYCCGVKGLNYIAGYRIMYLANILCFGHEIS
jgi:hypothetical protein